MSKSDDLKAPTRKPRAASAKPAAAPAPKRPLHVEPAREYGTDSTLSKVLLFVVFAAIGAGAMYLALPVIMGPQAPASGVPAAAGGGKGPASGMVLPVEGVQASKKPMAQSLTVTASLNASESATIKPEVSGRIVSIPFTEGAEVKKGDVLFKMDDSVQRAALGQAQADASLSRNNVKRYKDLLGSRAVARVQVEEAQAQLNTATANIALAKANLDKMTIRAPFDGKAGIRNASVGDVVDASNQLVTVTQVTPLRVIFDLPERFLPAVAKDQVVKFTVESHPDRTFDATIMAIDSTIDPVTRAVRIQASAPNDDGALLSGQFATLAFSLTAATEALVVPESALIPEGGQFNVFVVGADGAVAKTPVTPGTRDGRLVEISKGLAEGDTVVTAGQQKLFPGMKVKVMPPSEVTVAPSPEEASQ